MAGAIKRRSPLQKGSQLGAHLEGGRGDGERPVDSACGSQEGAELQRSVAWKAGAAPVGRWEDKARQGSQPLAPLPGRRPGCRAACAHLPGTPPLQSRGGEQEAHQGEPGRRSQGVAGALPSKHRTAHTTCKAKRGTTGLGGWPQYARAPRIHVSISNTTARQAAALPEKMRSWLDAMRCCSSCSRCRCSASLLTCMGRKKAD